MNTTLQIVINAIDNASATLQGVGSNLNSVGTGTKSLFSDVSAASDQVLAALTLVGAAATAAATTIGIATMDTQVATARLDTTTTDSITNANAAAKGQGALGDMLHYAQTQANLAADALHKLETNGKGTADTIDAAQMKFDLANAKLQVLQGRMDDVGKSASSIEGGFQGLINKGVSLGFTVDDTTNALNILEPMMGSKLASSALLAAENLARMSNGTMGVAEAAKLLGTAMETGMGRGLAQFGIIVKDGVGGTDLLTAAMEQSKGQADAYANTLSGALSIAWAHINQDMSDSGNKYMPLVTAAVNTFTFIVLPALVNAINTVIGFIERHQTAFALLAAGILATVIPAFVAWGIAAASAAIATAIALAPFFVAGVATAAIVMGIFWVIDNWKTIWTGFQTFIKALLDTVLGFFKPWFDSIMAIINPIINAVRSVGSMVGGVVSAASNIGSSMLSVVPHLSVHDAIITPGGQVIQTDPADYLFATKNPGSLGGGGVVNVYIQGGNYLDSNGATMIANAIGKQIVRQLRVSNFN
jgi:hypothetical protein